MFQLLVPQFLQCKKWFYESLYICTFFTQVEVFECFAFMYFPLPN